MKAKFFLLAAIAATMSLASCSNDEDSPSVPTDTQSKSVSITLANVKSPVTGRSIGSAVQESTTAKLNTFTIFFADANGKIDYEGYSAEDPAKEGDPVKRTYNSDESIPTFHYLDSKVTKVIVVGNPTWNEGSEPTTESGLKALSLDIADQQDVDELVLIGEATLVPIGSGETEKDNETGHTNVYKADVSILPLVARVEIAAFEYAKIEDETDRVYTSITLNHLAINNYSPTCTYGKDLAESTNYVNATIDNSTVWPYLNNLEEAWNNDVITGDNAITLNEDGNYYSDEDVASSEKVFAYNVFVGESTTTLPQLVLGLTGTKSDDSTAALYLKTNGLGVDQFKAGVIYRMDITWSSETQRDKDNPFRFTDNDLTNPDRCVDVNVTVKEWTVEYLTPTFGD